ncbi:hypothetical protein B5X24_HaOG204510 [Helicoverpa armigera]|uniref:Secreted protein n=1 Tax=Helicoverpa armigera TaxID=29058 RepID=A0A2W1BUN0_HELAM|nr:hypothetical protein B5X24_HaOG204510 [Helicoverpa armigera]
MRAVSLCLALLVLARHIHAQGKYSAAAWSVCMSQVSGGVAGSEGSCAAMRASVDTEQDTPTTFVHKSSLCSCEDIHYSSTIIS